MGQGAVLSFRTGSISPPPGEWCPLIEANGDTLEAGAFIGFYLTGDDGEVDPPSTDFGSCGEPTDDDIRATENTIGNGLDHYVLGYNELPFVPSGNLGPGNGNIILPDTGYGTEPVINIGDVMYLRAFNSDSVHTATHYFDLFTVNGDTQNTHTQLGEGTPEVIRICFTDAILLDCDTSAFEPDENPSIVSEYRLYQNYPNPFNPQTTINYDVKLYGHVTIKVFNLLGQEVETMVNTWQDMGNYNVTFNASGLASGVYFYQIKVNDFSDIKKMVLLQ
jgi:hypothetical protein